MCSRFLSLYFFFSSRRRHTRYIGDWSSNVCSSDLVLPLGDKSWPNDTLVELEYMDAPGEKTPADAANDGLLAGETKEIGRASCRERVGMGVGEGEGKRTG